MLPLKVTNPRDLGFIVHNILNGTKDTPDDLHLNVNLYNEVWIISGDKARCLTQPTAAQLLNGGGKYFLASDPGGR
jgi:pullulanase